MTSHKNVRIVLADDHLVVRQGLQAILETEDDFEIVGQASNGLEACALYESLQPDILVLDLRMPEMNGFEVVRSLNQRKPKPHILVMTTYDSDEDIWRCIKAGAQGYLLKDASYEQIFEAIRTVAAGERFTTAEVAAKITRRAATVDLTKRELEVLAQLATGATNKEIASLLFVSEGTVKTHLKSIFEKLNVSTRTEAARKATELGYFHQN